MIVLPSCGCIALQCQGTVGRMIGMRGHRVGGRLLALETYLLLRREHCGEEFLESERNILDSDTGEQDVTLQPNHTEQGEIGKLEV